MAEGERRPARVGADREWRFSLGLRRAVLRFLAFWLGVYGGATAVTVAVGAYSPLALLSVPFAAVVPVNPQGRGDFYLAAA